MIPFPNKKYNIIYADPAWYFKSWSKKGDERSATQHYDCMSISDICSLPISNISEDDCILLIWVIDPMLPQAFEVIKAWGFKYSTVGFTWVKTTKNNKYFFGLGYWTRANPEICLIAKKGSIKRLSKKIPNLIVDQIREHSRKPDITRTNIVELCGDLPRVELFARQRVDGWDNWGNQL